MKPLFFSLICTSLTFSTEVFSDGSTATIPPKQAPNPYFNKPKAQTLTQPTASTTKTTSHSQKGKVATANPHSFRFSARHKEANGIGYNEGYTSLDGFFIFESITNWYPFFDVRAHLFNNGKPAANLGFGLRYLPDTIGAVFGVNGFLDFKATSHSSFEQAGVGLEILGSKWEMRINGYIPMFCRNNLYNESFYQFHKHSALFQASRELAFKGFDLSLGRSLIKAKHWDFATTLGGYQFFADYGMRATGGLLKFTSNISPYFTLETQGSYDNVFKGIMQIEAAFNIPLGKRIQTKTKGRRNSRDLALADRLAEKVNRFEMIVSDKYAQNYAGKDPRTGEQLNIIFVNNLESGGNGTSEHPYGSLSAAEAHSSPGDMIYVYGGDGSPRQMTNGITLKTNQWLQAGSSTFVLDTPFGLCEVPTQSRKRPSIRNLTGDTVVVTSGNIIKGFDIRSGNSNIIGLDVHDLIIQDNRLLGNAINDIWLLNNSGNIIITNNTSNADVGLRIRTGEDIILVLEKNTFTNALSNLDLGFTDTSNSQVVIRKENSFSDSVLGSIISTQVTSNAFIYVENNTFGATSSSAPACLVIASTANSTITAVIRNNDFTADTQSLALGATLLSTSNWYVIGNSGTYTGSVSPTYPFTFASDSTGIANLLLVGNFASNNGYSLSNGAFSTFTAESPTLSLTGLENINTGSFTTTGSITYVPFVNEPPTSP